MREEHQPSPGQSLIGRYNAQVYGSGTATVNVYESIAPRVVDASTLDAAAQKLATLPLGRLPVAGALTEAGAESSSPAAVGSGILTWGSRWCHSTSFHEQRVWSCLGPTAPTS